MKKTTAILLTALILSSALSSCGNGEASETILTTETSAETTSAETVFDPFEGLPEMDYEGYKFNLQLRPSDRWTKDMYVEDATGDVVDDAIFERNSKVSEKFNIEITFTHSTNANGDMSAREPILAGDDIFDLVVAHGRNACTYGNEKLMLDWNTDLPYINLDQPWWDQDARNNLSINDKLYVMIGDISYCSMGAANIMLFNKELFDAYGLEYPYQLVKDEKWTYDTWAEMLKIASADLNGDAKYDKDNDRFGYITQKWVGPMQAFTTSGLRVFEKDSDDIPYITLYSEKTVEVFNKYFDLIESDAAYVDLGNTSFSEELNNIFMADRAMFFDMNMNDVIAMRAMETDFGIIPWPKYDENSKYCTNVDAGTNMCVVPITAGNPERTSIIIEALCAIGYESVIPAYFDVALQTKASRDEDSADMLYIIKQARVFDLGYYNSGASGAFASSFVTFAATPSLGRNFASWYDTNESAVQESLENVIEQYFD